MRATRVFRAIVIATASVYWCIAPSLAATFPRRDLSVSQGYYEGLYMAIRGVDADPLSQERISQIEASSTVTREFYAANSGGAYDLRYTHIVDVPLTLNEDGTRPSDWIADAEEYVRANYGVEPEDFHANIFDVHATEPDPGQGWSGLAWIPSNNIAVQADITSDWGQIVLDHELGHRVGAPHSGAWRALDDRNYTPYVYDYDLASYTPYSEATHGLQAAPYGVHRDEYGNPFDVMGNISHGHFSAHEKLTDLNWLSSEQVPNLDSLGEGVHRLYAHDELEVVYNSRLDKYGVDSTYANDKLYGLTYTRDAEEFDPDAGAFVATTQRITLEYRTGADGIQIYLGDAILDLDLEGGTDRNNLERDLEIGQSIRDIDLGVSFYASSGDGDDFLSHNPPAPTAAWEIGPPWYEFVVLGLGADDTGSYVDISVALEDYALETSVEGDLNRDGVFNHADWLVFAANTHSDLTTLTKTGRYLHGDFNSDGKNDYEDFVRFKQLYTDAHGASAFSQLMQVPEPASALLLALLALAGTGRRGQRASHRHDANGIR